MCDLFVANDSWGWQMYFSVGKLIFLFKIIISCVIIALHGLDKIYEYPGVLIRLPFDVQKDSDSILYSIFIFIEIKIKGLARSTIANNRSTLTD